MSIQNCLNNFFPILTNEIYDILISPTQIGSVYQKFTILYTLKNKLFQTQKIFNFSNHGKIDLKIY